MKHFLKLICGLLYFCTVSGHAQKENAVFPYSYNVLIELIQDSAWLKRSAEQYLQYANNASVKPFIGYEIAACAILNENEEGVILISKELLPVQKSVMSYSWQRVMYSIWYGYFFQSLHPGKNSYYNAVKQTFAKCDPSVEDRKQMYIQQIWADSGENAFNSLINCSGYKDDTIASRLYAFCPNSTI